MSTQNSALSGPHTPWAHVIRTAIMAAIAVCIVLLAFAWPSVTAQVKDLPVAAVGTQEQIDRITANAPDGTLDLRTVSTRDEAVDLIKKREVYGAIILGQSPEILTASAASSAASGALTQMGTQMQLNIQKQVISGLQDAVKNLSTAMQNAAKSPAAAPTTPAPTAQALPEVKITDVVPLSEHDPRGTGLAVAGLPLAMGGMIGGVLISLLVSGTWRRLVAIAAYGIVAGLAIAGILQGWFQILQNDYWVNAGAIGLGIVATAATIVGLNSLMGRAGIALGAVITLFIGNPISSLAQPKEFLPGAWGEIGQYFVPGASGTLLRDLSYFPDASLAQPIWVLVAWTLVGAVLIMVGRYRNQAAVAEA